MDTLKHFMIQGSVVLVTGAGTGIGQATSLTFAGAGASVLFLVGRRRAPLEQTAAQVRDQSPHCRVEIMTTDVSHPGELKALVAAINTEGRIDGIVNNAGMFSGASLEETQDEDWRQTFAVNLEGPFRLIRGLLPLLKKSDHPSIVNISSTLAVKPIPNAVAYSTSKAALVQMTRNLALELAPEGIRVNCILPAVVETPMYRGRFDNEASYKDGVKAAAQIHPLGRMGHPQDIANAALYLMSSASSWVTGVSLPVDGGMLVT